MTTIRFRLFLILAISISAVAGFAFLSISSFAKYASLNQEYAQSFEIEELVQTTLSGPFSKTRLQSLQEMRGRLQGSRMEAMSTVIQAYADKNRPLAKIRATSFIASEHEYRRSVRPLLAYLEAKVKYYGAISLATMLSSLFLISFYLQASVFRGLKNLSRKMLDFLNNRYTYQFHLPPSNEVGYLQATFNAMAQQVIANMEELTSLDKAKSEFLSIASHELRTPLTSIKGSLSLLKTNVAGQLSSTAGRLVQIAEVETDRLIRLINDILDLAKIEARRLPLSLVWTPIKPLLQSTLDGLQGLAQTAKVELVCGNLPSAEALIDRDRIQQVLTNLLSNAIKFSEANSQVIVNVDVNDQDELMFAVTDRGRGIAPEDQELIFQKFRQATSEKNPLVKGTGLGLAIAKALVDEHKGQIGVRSTPGQGSTFYFTLPTWRFTLEKGTEVKEAARVAA